MLNLFSHIETNNLRLKNRIVLPPMATEKSTSNGTVTDQLIKHYTDRAKDLGLMIVEHSYVHPSGKLSKKQLGSYSDDLLQGLRNLVDEIHKLDTPIVLQINHAGGTSKEEIIGRKPLSPSKEYFNKAVKMTKEDIKTIKNSFSDAAVRAEKVGFDGIEVHGAHGFLLGQFTSPLVNNREDEYGGSLENRMRFPLEVVEAVKNKTDDIEILYRLGSTDLEPEGQTVEESIELAKRLEEIGVDMIDVSGNMCGSAPESLDGEQGFFIEQANKIKQEVDVPVIGVGGIREPEFANKMIKDEKVDLIAVGREYLKDPKWACKAKEKLQS